MKKGIAKAAAAALWRVPGRFQIANLALGSSSLRCVVFHNISSMSSSPFTDGIRVTITPEQFETALKFITAHYSPVGLDRVLDSDGGGKLPDRPILVTFDDAYASVAEYAGPACKKYGIPALFFVNAAFIGGRRLFPDNLICYVFNVFGCEVVRGAVQRVSSGHAPEIHTLTDVFHSYLPAISLAERELFLEALKQLSGIDEQELARDANLYLSGEQLRSLKACDFEFGNHTYTHVYCRTLSRGDFGSEIDRNKIELEEMTGQKVRSFSVPYGYSQDLTDELQSHLRDAGHQAVFLSESVANSEGASPLCLSRVSTLASSEPELFAELEVLPRLRAQRNRFMRSTKRSARNQERATMGVEAPKLN